MSPETKPLPEARPSGDPAVSDAAWASAVEPSFGGAVRAAYELLEAPGRGALRRIFHRAVREAGAAGAAQGRLLAEILPAVLLHPEPEVARRFFGAWEGLAAIGLQALQGLLSNLPRLLALSPPPAVAARIALETLEVIARSRPSHEDIRRFSRVLPPAFERLARRPDGEALRALRDLARLDRLLIEPFLAGLERGLPACGGEDLAGFVAEAEGVFRRQGRAAARAFLALETEAARRAAHRRGRSARLADLRPRLVRYLGARLGGPLAVKPLAEFGPGVDPGRMVLSDGQSLFLPEEIDRESDRRGNEELYRLLAGLEASLYEFGTFAPALPGGGSGSGLEGFLDAFPNAAFAGELFALFEIVRLVRCLEAHYPGLARRYLAALRAETGPAAARAASLGALLRLLLLGEGEGGGREGGAGAFARRLAGGLSPAGTAADSMRCVAGAYRPLARMLAGSGAGRRLDPPFGWRPWPHPAHRPGRQGISFLSPRRGCAGGKGPRPGDPWGHGSPDACARRFGRAGGGRPEETGRRPPPEDPDPPPAVGPEGAEAGGVHYPEWDVDLGDYLPDHVTVHESAAPPGPPGFYHEVLARRGSLVRATRRAFERLRPEGLRRLRGRPEGDAFDYGRLLEYAVDLRRGGVPDERLFVKHLPDRRDVAVLFLVDASRSTAVAVPGAGASVLAVEGEALVLLCEALRRLGDSFAIAAFSGSGRHRVEYRVVKSFAEPFSEAVCGRIGGLTPRRNTRLGAALRHAARRLGEQPARLRLLLLLSDGFPNDTGYRAERAVGDTRRAISELASRGIRFHAVTVNHPADARLDRLYGRARHHVITDVRELPGRLLRVYGGLTR
ncbi:MAG: VWA domain-containing protein [Desulfobacterales bacterium]